MKRTRKQTKHLREQIRKMHEKEEMTFEEIGAILGISHQLASYHYRKLSTGKEDTPLQTFRK